MVDLVDPQWIQRVAESGVVLPLYEVLAFLQVAHLRCHFGLAFAMASLALAVKRLSQRAGRALEALGEVLQQWGSQEVEGFLRLVQDYYLKGRPTEEGPGDILFSEWSGLVPLVLSVIREDDREGAEVQWVYGQDRPAAHDRWSGRLACGRLLRRSAATQELFQRLSHEVGVLHESDVPLLLAAREDARASSCELAPAFLGLTTRAAEIMSTGARASSELCEGGLAEEWEGLRGALTQEALADVDFRPWSILIFGLLARLRGKLQESSESATSCYKAHFKRDPCTPWALSAAYTKLLREAIEGGFLMPPTASAIFLAAASSECAMGVATAHLAILEVLVSLTLLGEPGPFDEQLQLWVQKAVKEGPSLKDVDLMATAGQRDLLDPLLLREVQAPERARLLKPPLWHLDRNLSQFGASLVSEEVWWLLEGFWTPAAGEPVEAVLFSPWPLPELAHRVFLRLWSL